MNEEHKRLAAELLPEPVRSGFGGAALVGGEPGEVVVFLGKQEVKVAVFAVDWPIPHTPEPRAEVIASVMWTDLPEDEGETRIVLSYLIEAARTIRLSRYETCAMCGEVNPPEWMGDEYCHSCMEQHLNIVF